MCNCVNIEMGLYGNQVKLDCPEHMKKYISYDTIAIDRCLLDEIQYLWSLGVRTVGSCCGHNKVIGTIGVAKEDIPKMKKLGYQVQFNPCRPNDEDSFVPKSLY